MIAHLRGRENRAGALRLDRTPVHRPNGSPSTRLPRRSDPGLRHAAASWKALRECGRRIEVVAAARTRKELTGSGQCSTTGIWNPALPHSTL